MFFIFFTWGWSLAILPYHVAKKERYVEGLLFSYSWASLQKLHDLVCSQKQVRMHKFRNQLCNEGRSRKVGRGLTSCSRPAKQEAVASLLPGLPSIRSAGAVAWRAVQLREF